METFKFNFEVKINKLVQFFILSDLFLLAGWGLVDPIFAVYVVEQIPGTTLVTVGWLVAIYLITKSVIQVPLAIFFDRLDGEADDFYGLILGLLFVGVTAFLFALVTQVWQLYLVQVLKAIAWAFYVAAWPAIMGRHLDKDKQAFEWTLDSTVIGIGAGIAGLVGSILASYFGYQTLFVVAGFMSFIAAAILLLVPNIILPRKSVRSLISFTDKDPSNPSR